MIPRYSRKEMAALWSDARRFEVWLEVELAACTAMEELGLVPAGTAAAVRGRVRLHAQRHQAAVHHAGLLAGQVDHRGRHVLGRGEPPGRNLAEHEAVKLRFAQARAGEIEELIDQLKPQR